jgi:hypothetical protein
VSPENSENGKRIRLISTSKPDTPLKPGDTGTVWRITQIGTRRVVWDNGNRFDLDPKTDKWEVLTNES